MSTTSSYIDEIYENQRRGLRGWGNELLITDRAPYSDRAGDAIQSSAVVGDNTTCSSSQGGSLPSLPCPPGWTWEHPWKIDTTYTQCDADGWSYAPSFSALDKMANEQTSRGSSGPDDTVRRRRWIRKRVGKSISEKNLEGSSVASQLASPVHSVSSSTTSSTHTTEHRLGNESNCQRCKAKFRLMRRRHHCRKCYDAVCKDCCVKARNPRTGRSQWYCMPCLAAEEEDISDSSSYNDNTVVSNSTEEKETGVPSAAIMHSPKNSDTEIPTETTSTTTTNAQKFCIECGNELPAGVKFCIECGTPAAKAAAIPVAVVASTKPPPEEIPETKLAPEAEEKEGSSSSTPKKSSHHHHHHGELQKENEKLRKEVEELQLQLEKAKAVAAAAASKPPTTSTPAAASTSTCVKDDPEYAKFFKLLKMGMPSEQVKLKMSASGLKPELLDTPDALIGSSSSTPPAPTESQVIDPKYEKYFKLLKMGMPVEQVKLKAKADGVDPAVLDGPPPMVSSGAPSPGKDSVKVKDDPKYEKYFKLLKMGMPLPQVKLKMSADGFDPDILDNPDAESSSSPSPPSKSTGLPPPTPAINPVSAMLAKRAKSPEPNANLPKKPTIKPGVEMRALFWTRVPVNVVSRTIWNDMSDSTVPLDSSEMEWMFRKRTDSKNNNDLKRKGSVSGIKADLLPKKILLLDPKRQQNVGIAIARFRMPVEEIKTAVLELDEQKISLDNLNSLIAMAPTVEEQDMLQNFDGETNQLGNVEIFFLEMLSISRYTQRIKCFRFMLTFETRILELQERIDGLVAATDQVNDSKKFKRVLETVLALGNYMNGGTPRGGAYGYKLDTLVKLHTIKAVDGRINLMHFLVHHMEEHDNELLSFAGELPHVSDAKRISLRQLTTDVNACNSELQMLNGQVRAAESNKEKDKFFLKKMSPFSQDASEVMEELKRDLSSLDSNFTELVTSFGEDVRKLGTEEFFSTLCNFTTEFKQAYRQNRSPSYREIWEVNRTAMEEEREEEKAKKKQSLEKRSSSSRSSSISTDSTTKPLSSEDAKALYTQVIAAITSRCKELKLKDGVDQFKQMSKKYGASEVTAEQYVKYVGKTFGARVVISVVPDMIKLLPDDSKREALAVAHEDILVSIKKDREERRILREKEAADATAKAETQLREEAEKKALSKAKAKAASQRVLKLKIEDIKPVEGEEAQQLHKNILQAVQVEFKNDPVRIKEFSANARKFGTEQMSAKEFYTYLTSSFESEFVARLVPDLARLLHDAEKRHALLKALCESAPGWARFAGL